MSFAARSLGPRPVNGQLSLFPEPTPSEPGVSNAEVLDPILFGWDALVRVTAAEAAGGELLLWIRQSDDRVVLQRRPFRPWLLLTSPDHAPSLECTELEGAGFRYLAETERWDTYSAVRRDLRDRHAEHLGYANATRVALTRAGVTLFKGMAMGDTRRMQVDIETAGLTPDRPDDRILLIAVSDNRGLREALEGDEAGILARFVELVAERDPDIIEGHNIHGFDLPFIAARAARHGIACALGRDGSDLRPLPPRTYAVGGITRPLTPWHVFGRHIIDTFLAVQRFDWARGSLASYGLKEVARAFGIAADERVELDREDMARLYGASPDRVTEYALQDVDETGRLAELVTPTEFYQTQMVPDGYGMSAVSGTGEKINSIFVRAYLHASHAIPLPQPTRSYAGGHTELRRTGVIRGVVKADVESLYPSIMLTDQIRPRTDELNVFLPALKELTERRLEAKARARLAEGHEHRFWDGLQNSFKVLINSFYGYLGAAPFNFNDPEAAAEVTRRGREIVIRIADTIERTGGSVIEIDTDGVYFTAPGDVDGEPAERAYIAQVGVDLPEGIRLAFDGRFSTMVSLKTKNYVLVDYDGRRHFKGASLRSRADEPFGREFLAAAVDLLVEGRPSELRRLYIGTLTALREHRVPVEQLARRERITEKTFQSAAKARLAAVAAGLSIGDYVHVYERADGRLGRADEYRTGDENVEHYADKLYKFACRLRDALGGEFAELVPEPSAAAALSSGQLELF